MTMIELMTRMTANVEPHDAFLVSRPGGLREWLPATAPGDVVGVLSDGAIGWVPNGMSARLAALGDVPLVGEPAPVALAVAGVVTVSGAQALSDQVRALRAALNVEIATRNLLVARMRAAGLIATV